MPNYTIDKGTLAENMAGRAEELHRGRLLKGTGDNYGNGG